MCIKIKLWNVIVIAAIGLAACEGTIPVLITDAVETFHLPLYAPPEENWGTKSFRVNHEGLNIKQSYKTSDDVIHIVLTGKITNGIPEGLLWNSIGNRGEITAFEEKYIPSAEAGTFGANAGTIGIYNGFGDFETGVVRILDTDPHAAENKGGSFVVALGSPDFSAEWVMAAPYSAIVIEGLVDATAGNVTITETNDSLHLLSEDYRKSMQTPNDTVFSYNNGILRKRVHYPYNPNLFGRLIDGETGRESRGGYAFLISEKANPRKAFLEIDYNNNGPKRRIEIDYSDVRLRQETKLTKVGFEIVNATISKDGKLDEGGAVTQYKYASDTPSEAEGVIAYAIDGTVDLDVIAVEKINEITEKRPEKPLYIRPYYEPADIDPSKAATNMINKIYLTDYIDGRRLNADSGLVLEWDNLVQAITLYVYKDSVGVIEPPSTVVINAELRLPFNGGDEKKPLEVPITKLTCQVEFSSLY